ncbi:MAG: murein biosynthesis integral membrane protein MurJ [Pirellulales bacterium]|nr:murein biosynthesis integral membrane protein MurJ [Pirellulales bacterium]
MPQGKRHPLIAATRVTSLGTLASRTLGMVRDMATAALFGLSYGGVMDALALAIRVPNLFRRLFAEGALAASYLPVLTQLLEKDRRHAWQLASVLLTCLAAFLLGLLLVGELICGLLWLILGDVPGVGLVLGLTATMLPYTLFICVGAQVAATLHALSHFAVPALAPTILNICWLLGAWAICPWFAPDEEAQAYVLAVCVPVAGVLQLAFQIPVLVKLGFRFDFHWQAGRDALGRVLQAMGPMVLGLAVTQVNTFLDSLLAWGLAAAPDGPQRIAWLGDAVAYPMQQGANAAVYLGERLYQFPLGILGIAVATAIFPLLSRHAARGQHDRLGADLTLGLRLVLCLGVPAGAGLVLLAEPLARLLFERGNFDAADAARTAQMISSYALGVWAYCALPVIVRGFYAMEDRLTPVRVGLWAVGLNFVLNVTLIWPLAERGLAVATSVAACVQVVALVVLFSKRKSPLDWPILLVTIGRTLASTALMVTAGWVTLGRIAPDGTLVGQLLRVGAPLAVSLAVYTVVYRLLGGREIGMLLGRHGSSPDGGSEVD